LLRFLQVADAAAEEYASRLERELENEIDEKASIDVYEQWLAEVALGA
jgi:hypothetical protein